MKVLVSVFNNLATDQRVEKVCATLFENGYAIELIGNSWGGIPEVSRSYPFSRIVLLSKSLKLAYPEFNIKLYYELLKRADKNTILLANDLDSLLPNYIVAKKLGLPLVFDSHEIFSEMPSLKGRFTQKIWKFLERKLIPNVQYMMTASESYANWFRKNYNIERPIIVQNFPKKIENISEKNVENFPKIILYQGAINPSRGLDKLIPAMKKIENAALWIVGDGPKKKEYQTLIQKKGLESKVQFLGPYVPEKLREITSKADLGLSIEENNGLSYYYSLPNKISDYIQSRIPILVSNFPEMSAIVRKYNVGEIIENHSEEEFSKKITLVLSKGKNYYKNNLERASLELCWENETPKILTLFEKVQKENFH